MLIEVFTGVAERRDIQIQKACRAVQIITTIGALSASVLASLKLVTKDGGTKILYDAVPLFDLAEIMAQDEGLFVKDFGSYTGALPIAGARSLVFIPVSYGGAYPLTNGDYLSLDLFGLNSGHTYRISAIEDMDQDGAGLFLIDKYAVSAPRTNQRFLSAGTQLIALPRTNLDKVQIFSKIAGRDVVYTAEELAGLSMYDNDIASIVARSIATTPTVNLIDAIYGFDNLFLVSVEDSVEYEVYCTGSAGYNFYKCNVAIGKETGQIKS